MLKSTLCHIILICLSTISYTGCEYFTSIGHMRYLFNLEKKLAGNLKEYIQREEARMSQLKSFYKRVKHLEEAEDHQSYVGHPNSAFKILSRLNKDWLDLKDLLESTGGEGKRKLF